jgi:hypothetical protein
MKGTFLELSQKKLSNYYFCLSRDGSNVAKFIENFHSCTVILFSSRKLRRNTKEALELVDRLCEQQLVNSAAKLKLGESSQQQQPANSNLNGTAAAPESSAWNGGDVLDADG